MRRVALSEIAELIDYGVTASANAEPVGPKFLRITDIQDGIVNWDTVPFCEGDDRKLRASRLAVGDIVFARTGATTGKSFLIRSCPERAVFASYLIRVRPSKAVHPEFLAQFFDSQGYWDQITLKSAGAAQPGVNASKLADLEVPLPPLEEQKRIAAILDQADALRRLRAHALDRLNGLGQAIFHEMFGDVALNSKGFPMGTVGDLAAETQYGTSEKAGDVGQFPVLRMNNLTYDGRMDLSSLKYMDLKAGDIAKHTVTAGDMLFNRTNSPELVGKTAVYRGKEPVAFAGYLVRLRANDGGNTDYISAVLNSSYGKSTLRGMCKSIIGMANINAKELCKIRLPLPPRDLQDEFAERLEKIEMRRSIFEVAFSNKNALFSSLQNRAFRGDL